MLITQGSENPGSRFVEREKDKAWKRRFLQLDIGSALTEVEMPFATTCYD